MAKHKKTHTHIKPLVLWKHKKTLWFYENIRKTFGFLTFSEGIKREYLAKIGYEDNILAKNQQTESYAVL